MANPTINVTAIALVGPAMGLRREEWQLTLDLGDIRDVEPAPDRGFTMLTLNNGEKVRVKGIFSNYEELVSRHA